MLNRSYITRYTTPKATKRFDELKPTHIGTTAGVRFFEHPLYGDESPLIIKHKGAWAVTIFWEVPSIHEMI